MCVYICVHTHAYRYEQQHGDSQREREWGEVEVGKMGMNGEGKRLDFGCEHKIQYADDLIESCT